MRLGLVLFVLILAGSSCFAASLELKAIISNTPRSYTTIASADCTYTSIQEALDSSDVKELYIMDETQRESGVIINRDVALYGFGSEHSIISGEGNDRIFEILENTQVVIEGMTIRGGYTPLIPRCGAGVCNYGEATIKGCVVEDNRAVYGAGIINFGMMTMYDSIIQNNRTVPMNTAERLSGEGCTGSGGGIKNDAHATLMVFDSTIRGNSSLKKGGGLFVSCESQASVMNTSFTENHSNKSGGAIHIRGDLELKGCTITSNTATNGSGGLHNQGHLDMTDCKLTMNSSSDYLTDDSGSGIYGTGEVGENGNNQIGVGTFL